MREDCFGLNKNGKCKALEVKECDTCAFYKPETLNRSELLKYNGTGSVDRAVKAYKDKKEGEG